MIAQALARKSVQTEVDEWLEAEDMVPVVRLTIRGPHDGLQGWATLTPAAAEQLSEHLATMARGARERRARQETARVAAQLGYPAEFGGAT